MKKKMPRKAGRKPIETRDTVAQQIARATKKSTVQGLALANYGSDAKAVLKRMANRREPTALRPWNEAGLPQFISSLFRLDTAKLASGIESVPRHSAMPRSLLRG